MLGKFEWAPFGGRGGPFRVTQTHIKYFPAVVHAQSPIAAQQWGEGRWLASVLANARYAPFAAPWNLAGWPAMVVPAGVHPNGTPLSVQLVGRPGTRPRETMPS